MQHAEARPYGNDTKYDVAVKCADSQRVLGGAWHAPVTSALAGATLQLY